MSVARGLRAPVCALLFSFAILVVAGAPPRAAAQATMVVPHPPIQGNHYAEQDKNDPETAYDRTNKHILKWDRVKKSWIDQNTGEALGFEGQLARNGEVIPAPPIINSPEIGPYWPKQSSMGNPDIAYDVPTKQLFRWDPARKSWFAAHWDQFTRSLVTDGPPLGLFGVVVSANAPMPPVAVTPTTETAPPCPTPEDCAKLQQIYMEADARSVAAADALIQATADRDSDLARAAQLDKSAAHRGDPELSKAEQRQAQALRDKLQNAQANYDAAAKAALDAFDNWRDCLDGLKHCPPKKPAQALNGTGTTSTPGGNTANAMSSPPSEPLGPSNAVLAVDLCDRAKTLRGIAAHERQLADAATNEREKKYHEDQANSADSSAKMREELARHYDPNSCPEHMAALPGGGGQSQSGAVAQNSGGGSTPSSAGGAAQPENAWTLPPYPGLPLYNKKEQRFYGSNPDDTPRLEGFNLTARVDYFATPEETSPPALTCKADTPTLRHEGMDELTVDVALTCTGTPPANSSIRLRSSEPISQVEAEIKFTDSGPTMMIGGTLRNDDHVASFDLSKIPANESALDMGLKYKVNLTAGLDRYDFGFRGSSGISINPPRYTAPITNGQIGEFKSFTPQWGEGYQGWQPSNSSSLGTPVVGTRTFGWGLNYAPELCTDTTTTSYDSPFNSPLPSSSYSPTPCRLDDLRGRLTFGPMDLGGWRGYPPLNANTPGGAYSGGVGSPVTPDQNGGYLNGTWGGTPRYLYGGNSGPFPSTYIGYMRPQSYYDDGPQYFGIFDPWHGMPYYCDYDFPDRLLRASPELAQALEAERDARLQSARESPTPSETGKAHLELASLRSGSYTADSSSRTARPARDGAQKSRRAKNEASAADVAPSSASSFTYSIVSNGKSTGQAFELQVADPTGKVKTVAVRDGTVLEAIKPGAAQPVAESPGDAVVKQPLNGYCLEFHKVAPAEGTLYRIADPPVQQKYAPLRFLDRAAAQMAEKNEFHPDSNPDDYKNFIFQYALWSKLEGWGEKEFTRHFVERTKENVEAKNVKWTGDMEKTLLGAAPGRWRDISEMTNQAQTLEKASQERINSRQSRSRQ